MQGRTHALIGAAAGLTIALLKDATPGLALVAAGAGAIGGLLPDIDHPNSTICNRVPLIRLLTFWIPHRTLTHSIWLFIVLDALYLMLMVSLPASPMQTIIRWGSAIMAGYFLHILADMTTRQGVPIFSPVSDARFYLLPRGFRLTTGGILESIIAACLTLLVMYQLALLFSLI
jgi:inner membrane protein